MPDYFLGVDLPLRCQSTVLYVTNFCMLLAQTNKLRWLWLYHVPVQAYSSFWLGLQYLRVCTLRLFCKLILSSDIGLLLALIAQMSLAMFLRALQLDWYVMQLALHGEAHLAIFLHDRPILWYLWLAWKHIGVRHPVFPALFALQDAYRHT